MSTNVPVGVSTVFVEGNVKQLKLVTSVPMSNAATDGLIYCFAANPATYVSETRQPSTERFVPMAWIGQINTNWQAIGQDFLKSIGDKLAVTDQLRERAAEITQGCTTNREKLAAIAGEVQQGYTYQAIEFGRRSRIPNPAPKTMQLKYGDCKDHAVTVEGVARRRWNSCEPGAGERDGHARDRLAIARSIQSHGGLCAVEQL